MVFANVCCYTTQEDTDFLKNCCEPSAIYSALSTKNLSNHHGYMNIVDKHYKIKKKTLHGNKTSNHRESLNNLEKVTKR